MAITVTTPKRVFEYTPEGKGKVKLPDPSSKLSVREVLKFYSTQYPEIITGEVTGPVISFDKEQKIDVSHYKISSSPGTHG